MIFEIGSNTVCYPCSTFKGRGNACVGFSFGTSQRKLTYPFLHSNSSIIEALFAQVRSTNNDTAHGYIGAIGAIDARHSAMALVGNKMYDPADVEGGQSSTMGSLVRVSCRRDKERQERAAKMVEMAKGDVGDETFCLFGNTGECLSARFGSSQRLLTRMTKEDMHYNGDFISHAFDDGVFQNMAVISCFRPQQEWFGTLCSLDEKRRTMFNEMCSKVMKHLFRKFEDAVEAKPSSQRFLLADNARPSSFF